MTDAHSTPDPVARAARRVGRGRVVYDDRPTPDATDDAVEEGSEESFPASDAPAFVGDGPGNARRRADAANQGTTLPEAGSLSARPSA